MHSISDERNWLTWLVKVRLLILTVLLAIAFLLATVQKPAESQHRNG